MLLRSTAKQTIAIAQPAHAWLAGILARAWGNAAFEAPLHEAFYLAVSLHDIGWLERDRIPQYDLATGLPLTFWDVPAHEHTALWRNGVAQLESYNRHAAILVSMHGDTIYDKTFDPATASPENADAVRCFRKDQRNIRRHFMDRQSRDSLWDPDLENANFEREKLLLAALDTLSLNICWGVAKSVTIADVPTRAKDTTSLTLEAHGPDIRVDPWPFTRSALTVRVEGRPIWPASDKETLENAFAAAESFTIVTRLFGR